MKPALSLFALLAALTAPISLGAQDVYTYVDESGTICFSDSHRPGARKMVIRDGRIVEGAGRFEPLGPEVPFSDLFNEAGRRYALDPRLLASVAGVESAFNPRAVSSAGAKGVMQLVDGTAAIYGVSDIFSPSQNIHAGSRHLSYLLNAFDGDLRLALAAYNAGRSAVLRHGGVPPYDETRRYLQKIAAVYGDLNTQISRGQIDNSFAAARAVASGKGSIYRFTDAEGNLRFSDRPPNSQPYEKITFR